MRTTRNARDSSPPRVERRRAATRTSGVLMIELLVAMTIAVAVLLPLLFSFAQLHKSARISYQRGIAMELVDGEMEILMAGEWHEFKEGVQAYSLRGNAAANLPPGKAQLTVSGKHLRLEWLPDKPDNGGKVIREAVAK